LSESFLSFALAGNKVGLEFTEYFLRQLFIEGQIIQTEGKGISLQISLQNFTLYIPLGGMAIKV